MEQHVKIFIVCGILITLGICALIPGIILVPGNIETPFIVGKQFDTPSYSFRLKNRTESYNVAIKVTLGGYTGLNSFAGVPEFGTVAMNGEACTYLAGSGDIEAGGGDGMYGSSSFICDDPSNNALLDITFPFGAKREGGIIGASTYTYGMSTLAFGLLLGGIGFIAMGIIGIGMNIKINKEAIFVN